MAFDRPSLTVLNDRISADVAGALEGTDARLRVANTRVISRAMAGAAHGMHGHIAWWGKQFFPDSAEAEQLLRLARIWQISRLPAAAAQGSGVFAITGSVTVPAGHVFQRADGVRYTAAADVISEDGAEELTVGLVAEVAGAVANAVAGVKLYPVSPVTGLASVGEVDEGGLDGGADIEGIEALRARLLGRLRAPPQGGNRADFEAWARTVPGVTRAWVYPGWMGEGTVGVTFMLDGEEDPIPNEELVEAVQAVIEPLRPVTAEVVVFAPTPLPLDLEVHINPDTPAVRQAVEAELRALVQREAVPGGTLPLSHITEAVSIAAGEYDHAVVSPTAAVECAPGEILVLGAITWV